MQIVISNFTGSSKTLTMTHIAVDWYKKWGMDVYSNYDIAIPHTRIEDIDDVLQVGNGLLLLDESDQVFGDTRHSNAADNIAGTIAGKVARKRGVSMIMTVQGDSMADIRVRQNADFIYTPSIEMWVNIQGTAAPMKGPLSINQRVMVEMARDENDKIWYPGLIKVIAEDLDKKNKMQYGEKFYLTPLDPIYKGMNVFQCYNTDEVILKKAKDNDALKKAVRLEKVLTKKLRADAWGYHVDRVDESGFHHSYQNEWIKYVSLDINMTHPGGHNVWLDVVGVTTDSGYPALMTKHKNWEEITASIRMHGPAAVGYLAFVHKKEWMFSEINLLSPALQTKNGSLKKSNIHLSRILPHSVGYEEWLDVMRVDGERRVSDVWSAPLRFGPDVAGGGVLKKQIGLATLGEEVGKYIESGKI